MSKAKPFTGSRIVVWGVTGSGKTTFARHLGKTLSLGVVDLDAIRHANGWDSTPYDEFREKLTELLKRYAQGWVIVGNYSAIMDVYMSLADTIVWLHVPWRVWRVLRRTVRGAWTGEPVFENSPVRESWRLSFLSRKSILWWSIHHHRAGNRSIRRHLAELPPSVRVHELRSSREVGAFLSQVQAFTTTLASTS